MFKKMFKKKEEVTDVSIHAPVNGILISLEDVPDPVFSQKMMGNGIAVKPTDGVIVALVEGKVIQVFPTKHAIGIKAVNGAEILIHIGLDTVNLEGEGFIAHVQEGNSIKVGDKLITFDLDIISEKTKSILTPVIITNTDDMEVIRLSEIKKVTAAQDEILFVSK
ncbi:PTS glucose transporter subunit IIA [Virgibacillus sp. C22-A2]|uniref:PTS glucose transporter subunit IIA n=1 Tax=Virgibacillus tibetensis TaxID=3042313 RepID=A0ABU6KGF5_9BACI|nr:PTS glucose transporter subunit IIA [Virgibacillus sp. C22-A2]